ncbi:channel protein, hemolysin III family [Gottschalkia purinilytica]|uniref:Channel protein, hemolysin III family n=1 Tax=Gottschalkia purinilytica TaxID=1503 RepID=A0A0L0WF25_GOTPU|nr:hemolysin III family protein [Gottschalkia purinilytica]KNF10087.1 channel protein, hemolysin III family [Gottschalkia purinilytica]
MNKTNKSINGEEITNAISHGVGLCLAIAALVILVVFANKFGSVWHIVSFSIYGSTLILLYLFSTLYHSFPDGKVKSIFKVFDHSAIYLLIAGTYTPLTLTALRGKIGWTLFGIVWAIAIAGIIFKILWIKKFKALSTILYIAMGWLVIFAIKPLFQTLNTTSMVFLVVGGVLYTVGTIFYSGKKIKYNHAIWHFFVLAGSACHFFTVLYLLPR